MRPVSRLRFVLCVASIFVASPLLDRARAGEVERSVSQVGSIALKILGGGVVTGPENFEVKVVNKDTRFNCVKVKHITTNFGARSNSLGINSQALDSSTTVVKGDDGLCNFTKSTTIPVWRLVKLLFNIQNPNGPYSSQTGQYIAPRREDVWNFLTKQCEQQKRSFTGIVATGTSQHNRSSIADIGKPGFHIFPDKDLSFTFQCPQPAVQRSLTPPQPAVQRSTTPPKPQGVVKPKLP